MPEFKPKDQTNNISNLNIWQALIPIVVLVVLLAFNVLEIYQDDALGGSNQFILLISAAVAIILGTFKGVSYKKMMDDVAKNIKSTAGAILILLMVGALAGTWLLSGVIPVMVYYGLQLLHPSIFLAACVIICSLISISTGSSWTTSATVGIALIGIAQVLGISVGMTAGAILSGAYFGDKLSPMSDTTNLAPAMAGTDLFTHIRYMTLTTVPSISVTLIVFLIIGFNLETASISENPSILKDLKASFFITPWLFIVPILVIVMIVKKTPPLVALFAGTLLGAIAALIFQPDLVLLVADSAGDTFNSFYKGLVNTITGDIKIPTDNELLTDLFQSSGMKGMLNTIWLIICAMVFGGVMEAIGALQTLSKGLLNLFHTTFGLFASTVASCLALNATASDQYLAIVIPGKMFSKAYKDKGLAPENLSRALEDSGTVTSVLIPYNTCGAYHSNVLGVPVADYFVYAIFNYISPFMTLIFAAFNIKIRQLKNTL
ncbi:Na+/H+ antiporter NhaC [Mesohalobacter halotolerans]|jgi:NhaC family Na+:H+ antiporter|uniref:Na+/H+ antiporter NhaC n=1 Tax=Mesohalobacter halotolerans TaxID=1883405 RepID=A0A4V6ALC1_9FLAO|nr:Na+/H+ antiporter NhaC [Mesohalobacter halotolerans]MBS3738063.1 Na+/H+ antiporter NhaC [Psychroflexus sp.]NBC57113.1 Na+/H+ antiporter NhaC [Bacteroidota bacterium]TKS56095.1 Na+/H+ antiporter NhaC [Mesohalobacter halotolerans]